MIAILAGLGAAAAWAAATVCSSRSTRMIGPASVLAWVMLTGLLVVVPWAVAVGRPSGLDAEAAGWLVVAGLGNVVGLLLVYSALRIGKVGIVAPIVSTEGAIAAVLAVLAGEHLGVATAAALAAIAVGVALAASARDIDHGRGTAPRAIVASYALAAAGVFGLSIYATGRVSQSLPLVWAVVPARVAGVVLVAAPLLVAARLTLSRRALPLVVAAGLAEVAGFALFGLGARHGIAVTAVLGSQFAALAAVAAYVLFRERLSSLQLAGVVTVAAGVAILAALQA